MALITRLARLFQADVHAILDKIEEPSLLLHQSIRDMEESIANDEKQLRSWEYEIPQLIQKHDQLEQTLTDLDDKCALCFQSNKDDLARSFIKRKLETQQAKHALAEQIRKLKDRSSRLADQLNEHQAQLTAMKLKAEGILKPGNSGYWENPSVDIRDEDVEVAFLFEKQKWSEL